MSTVTVLRSLPLTPLRCATGGGGAALRQLHRNSLHAAARIAALLPARGVSVLALGGISPCQDEERGPCGCICGRAGATAASQTCPRQATSAAAQSSAHLSVWRLTAELAALDLACHTLSILHAPAACREERGGGGGSRCHQHQLFTTLSAKGHRQERQRPASRSSSGRPAAAAHSLSQLVHLSAP